MRVKRDFDEIYANEEDPWSIGDADSERYDLYVELIASGSDRRGTALELGCGFGAFLSRFRDHFDQLFGLELSATAVAKGRERFPFIEFVQGSLGDPGAALPDDRRYDTIIVSDVLYYLRERERQSAIKWIAEHLADGGLAFLAGWSPGGRYMDVDEFRNLVEREFAIEHEQVLETDHVVFCCRRLRTLAALTVDSETWQPQPEGFVLDWETDVLEPTERLLEVFDAAGVPVTIFAEMGEHLWLTEHEPDLARRIEAQWRDAVSRGHDVQLHLHPNWLPEMGPAVENGRWTWDMNRTRAADYPGDLVGVIARCKRALEEAIRPVAPDYEVVAYRAGTYEAQPFDRLYDALLANGIWCDSSVLPGDHRPGRSYDYAHAYHRHQPWFAGRHDPQLKAPPAEQAVVELPVYAPSPGERWTFDNEEGSRFADRLLSALTRERRRPSSEALRRRRKRRERVGRVYTRLGAARRLVNPILAGRISAASPGYARERLVGHRYFVLLGHTKVELDFDAIASSLERLRRVQGVELVSLRQLAGTARAELARDKEPAPCSPPAPDLGRLDALIPLDRQRVLELLDPAAIPDEPAASDCIKATAALERSVDVEQTLRQLRGALGEGGCLVAALWPDGLNPARTCGLHTWKTIPSDVRARLVAAGFSNVEIRPINALRELHTPPFPPSNDQMLYVRAWREPPAPLDRVRQLTTWTYRALDPERAQESNNPLEVLAGGYAWCWGYVLVLGEALRREGFEVRWVTMLAEGHPRGLGKDRRDTHEVLEVTLPGSGRVVCDPMVGIVFEASLAELLRDPASADTVRPEDDRYRSRSYALYSTSAWYRLVRRVGVRRRPGARLRLGSTERYLRSSG